MKIRLLLSLFFALLLVSFAFTSGCQESDLKQDRRARLVGNQNLALKKQLNECNDEIQRQKDLLEQSKNETEIANLKAVKISQDKLQVMQITTAFNVKIEKLMAENEDLKEKITELQSKL